MKDEKLKTGTTTVGIVCKDGIVLAADKRSSAGYMVADKRAQKVIKINDDIAVTTAGLVSDLQLLTKIIKAQLKLVEVRNGKKASTKQAANLLAGLVYSNIRKMSMFQSIVGFLLGGKDQRGFYLYNIGVDGALTEFDDYCADGSGMQFALGVLEANYKKDLTVEEGIKLAVKTINTAIKRDIATGNGIDVVTITKDGVKKVFEKELEINLNL
jgi:proteasome beta subunit